MMLFGAVIAGLILLAGCSGGSSPVQPGDFKDAPAQAVHNYSQTHLWGYYDVYIDIPTQTAIAVLNRQAMFTANVVTFLNGKTSNLSFHINKTPVGLTT